MSWLLFFIFNMSKNAWKPNALKKLKKPQRCHANVYKITKSFLTCCQRYISAPCSDALSHHSVTLNFFQGRILLLCNRWVYFICCCHGFYYLPGYQVFLKFRKWLPTGLIMSPRKRVTTVTIEICQKNQSPPCQLIISDTATI